MDLKKNTNAQKPYTLNTQRNLHKLRYVDLASNRGSVFQMSAIPHKLITMYIRGRHGYTDEGGELKNN